MKKAGKGAGGEVGGDAERLRRLLQRRLRHFERQLARACESESIPPQQLEREARALIALMKALAGAAEMEREAAAFDATFEEDDDDIRQRLARQLEALCAKTRPPRRGGRTG